MSRQALEDLLVLDDLRSGLGSDAQLEAYRELEWRKCQRDPAYFIETYCYLKLKSGKVAPFDKLFPCQRETIEELLAGDSVIQVKSRQLGQTTGIAHYALWDIIFNEAVKWNFFGADEDASKDIKSRLDVTVDRLPQWIKDRAGKTVAKTNKKKDGTMGIGFGMSEITLFSGSVKKAQGMSGKIFLDDFGKHTEAERKWQLIYPTIDDPVAANRGQVAIVFNGDGEDFCYHLYQTAKKGDMHLKAHFYSWMDDPRRLHDPYEEDGITKYPWYENSKQNYLIENPDRDTMAFKAQYPTTEDEAFYISDVSRFNLRVLEGMKQMARKHTFHAGLVLEVGDEQNPVYRFRKHGRDGHLRVYEHPRPDARYVIGVDSAGGISPKGDYSVAQVFEVCDEPEVAYFEAGWQLRDKSWTIPDIDGEPAFEPAPKATVLKQVAVYQARPEPGMFGGLIVKVARYYNDAFVVPEANSHGQTVINKMKELHYHNMYRRVNRGDSFTDGAQERYGFYTDADSKVDLINVTAEWIATGSVIIRDNTTLKELGKYRTYSTPTGRTKTSAPKGQHDDHVMALAMAVYGTAVNRAVKFKAYDFY